MTLLGCVAAVLVPMPICFYLYGKKIRAKSNFAPAPDLEQEKRRDEESKGDDNEYESADMRTYESGSTASNGERNGNTESSGRTRGSDRSNEDREKAE